MASKITVPSGVTSSAFALNGSMYVNKDAIVDDVTVNRGAYLYISSGGSGVDIKENGGGVLHDIEAQVSFVPNTFSGVVASNSIITVHSGTTAVSTTVAAGGSFCIFDGGFANTVRAIATGRANVYVSNGGFASDVEIGSRAYMYIFEGGSANKVSAGLGSVYIYEGGAINGVTAGRFAEIYVSSGGSALGITENGGAVLHDIEAKVSFLSNTFTGATASNSIITVHSGTTAVSTTVAAGGSLCIYDGGVASKVKAIATGRANVYVSNGGFASDVEIDSRAYMYIYNGGKASNLSAGNGSVHVYNGGAVSGVTVGRFAEIYVSSGGSALGITENGGAVLHDIEAKVSFLSHTFTGATASNSIITVHSGTTAVSTTVAAGGSLCIYDGGVVSKVKAIATGRANVYVSSGGFASDVEIDSRAYMYIYDEGTVDKFKVYSNGYAHISFGGLATNGTVAGGGTLYISGGGVADNLVVSKGGCAYVGSNGWLTGKLTLAGTVSAYAGGIVDFDISGLSAGNAALVNDLSFVTGAPTFTVTVSDSQAFGTYTLAEGAANFTDDVAVINTVGDVLDWISVGESGNYEDRDFKLSQNAGKLSFTISKSTEQAPVVLSVSADITALTNKNVTVTATYSTNTVTKQYSLDNKTWLTYTTGVAMSANGMVYFRGLTKSGKTSEVKSYTVSNIDKVAPAKPTAKADVTTSTTGNVTVTATFSDDSAQKQYSTDNKTWKSYSSGVVMSANGTVYFRGIDAAGNISDVTSYKVTNITGTISLDGDTTKSGSYQSESKFKPNCAGFYKLSGSFGLMKGTIVILVGGKKVASGTLKNGVLVFNKGKDVLLDSTNYTIVVKNTDKGKTASAYSMKLTVTERFDKGDTTDNTQAKAGALAANQSVNAWVGYGDAVDWYKLGVNAQGGFYDLNLSGIKNNVRLTIYSKTGAKVKSVTASAKKPNIPLADLCLDNGSYAVIEAPNAAKAQNSDYALKLTEKATFNRQNNDWNHAEVLTTDATFAGALTKAAGGDVVDYCDISALDNLSFKTTAGKVKVSFYDTNKQAVKVAVKVAGGKDKTAAAVSLAYGKADRFTIGTLPSSVKYLKIEAAGKTLNSYTIGKIA